MAFAVQTSNLGISVKWRERARIETNFLFKEQEFGKHSIIFRSYNRRNVRLVIDYSRTVICVGFTLDNLIILARCSIGFDSPGAWILFSLNRTIPLYKAELELEKTGFCLRF